MHYELVKAKSEDSRCQAVCSKGVCIYEIVPTSKYCPVHGGAKHAKVIEANSIRNYRLAKYQVRLNEFADSSHLKSLTDEIAILRIVLEEIMLKCETTVELLSYTPRIADLASRIERLVLSCQKLDKATGQYMDKNELAQLGKEIVAIIASNISDAETLDIISKQIVTAIVRGTC